jgi:peptidoglycan/LPS O-acetylase OafA/YrhL
MKLRPGLWIYALALLLGLNEAIFKPLFPETHNLVHDWYVFNHFLLLTMFGILLASMEGSWDWLERTRRAGLAFSVSLTVVVLVGFDQQLIQHDTPADAFVANLFTWSWVLSMLGYGKRHLSFSNPLLRWARDASYPIYILHQTVIIAIAYYVIQQPWTPGVKYWIVLAGTLLICVALYEGIVRRFSLMRLVFGMKARCVAADDVDKSSRPEIFSAVREKP